MDKNEISKSITINASPEAVRKTLTEDDNVKQRAAAFSPGTYAVTDWKKGSVIERKTGDKTQVKGILTGLEKNKLITTTFYESLPDGTITDKVGNSIESYTITPQWDNSSLEIYIGPISAEERQKRWPQMETMRDNGLMIIKNIAEKMKGDEYL